MEHKDVSKFISVCLLKIIRLPFTKDNSVKIPSFVCVSLTLYSRRIIPENII